MKHRLAALRVAGYLLLATLSFGCSRSAPGDATSSSEPAGQTQASLDPCALISQSDLEAAVGNKVSKGSREGAGTCDWDTENPADVSVLLIAHRKGDLREPYLCDDLRKTGGNETVEGLDVAIWKFSGNAFFNSGNFDGCGPKGFLSLQVSGKRDEAHLKQATLALVRQAWKGM